MAVSLGPLLTSCLLVVCTVTAQVPVSQKMRSFSSAVKGGHMAPGEETLLYHRYYRLTYLWLYESNTGEPGVITEQWYTGGCMDENAVVRIYIDNETLPSIEFMLMLGHGVGFGSGSATRPWNTKRIALDAYHGTYNTYQIPFSKSCRVTVTHPKGGTYWYIIRGVYNYPLTFGVLQLPSNTRLRLYKNVDITLDRFEFIDMVNVRATAGALFQVTLAANSSCFQYLEGCVRAYIDGSETPMWLSSGTEDFFLSAYYFDKGQFYSDNSGLTYFNHPGAMSAYKFFETDPILFTKSLRLLWRSGEKIGGGLEDCPNDFKSPSGHHPGSQDLKTAVVTTYAWVYEW